MKKSELLKMDRLTATPQMMRRAANDKPKVVIGYRQRSEQYKYDLYLRCRIQNNILKVVLFWTADMHKGGNLPIYEIYFSLADKQFITYDCTSQKWRDAKLDVLEWPQYRGWYNMKVWSSRKTRLKIQNYLGTSLDVWRAMVCFQRQVRADQLEQRYKKETDQWDNDLAQTPPLPKDWKRWTDKVGIQENYIFYEYRKGGAKTGHCSYCEKEVPIRNPLHNKEGYCPRCRHKVVFKCIGRAGTVHTDTYYFYLLQRCKDGVMLREFEGKRTYRKGQYMKPEVFSFELRRMICDKNGFPQRIYYWGNYKQRYCRWILGHLSKSFYYSSAGRIYGRTLPNLAAKELKTTGLREYICGNITTDPTVYLLTYLEHPFIEKFVKAGLPHLAKDYIEDKCSYGYDSIPLSIQETSLAKLLNINGQELKRLRQNNGGCKFLSWLQYEKAFGKAIPDRTITWFCQENIRPRDLDFVRGKMSIPQIQKYIVRQMSESHMNSYNIINIWADYLSMAKRLKMDTNNELVYRVRDLQRRHNELVQSCQRYGESMTIRVGNILEEYPHIDEICQSLKEKYEYSDEEYMIIAPTCVEEIILEGRALNHCVSDSDRYWDRIESHESYILFLRKRSNPSIAYYTLEIEPDGTIRQKRSLLNEQYEDIEQASDFLLKWQKAVSERLTDEDRSFAKRSRTLRMEEFEQLRKDQVVVRTGTLSGKLLVDVLMNDLMENVA